MLENSIEFAAARASAIIAALPAVPAVFALRSEAGAEPYAGKSADLRRRLTRLLGEAEPGSKRLNLRQRCTKIEYTPTGSDFESALLLYRLLRTEFPGSYRERMKLRFAPLIKLNLENPYPRAYVTRRIGRLKPRSRYYGPLPSRAAAEKFLNDALDFFKLRRCDFDLNPDPAFPGCMYSEMKMCLAPCFKGCSDDEYRAETARVKDFLESCGRSLLRELESERERQSSGLQFEAAAQTHTRAEKVRGILGAVSLPEIVRPVDELRAVIVQPSCEPGAVMLFKVERAMIHPPVKFVAAELPVATAGPTGRKVPPRSMESRIAEALEQVAAAQPSSAAEWNEHIAILKRWYYRSRRVGEIFLADERGELPLRRIVRGVGRVLKGERAEEGETAEAHRAYWLARTRQDDSKS